MTSPLSGFVDRALDRVARAFRDATTGAREVVGAPLRPDLPDDELPRLRRQIDACLDGRGGETAARVRAAELGRTYLALSADGRRKFLTVLAREHGPDPQAIAAAIAHWQEAIDDRKRAAAEAGLRAALESPAAQLLARFTSLPEGVKFVVDLRAELLRMGRKDPAIARLAEDLRRLLGTWFDVGFLDLRHIDWRSPATLLEKLIAYEAVHAIGSWSDLKNRLDSDRRCFAFFHPRMPDEPLIFVEVALVDGMADNIQRLLDESAPTRDARDANTAVFYSISNCQEGLAGVSFGNHLIKRVAEDLKRELPRLNIFTTLSPISGFRSWLESTLDAEGDTALMPGEGETLAEVTDAAHGAAAVKLLLASPDWPGVRVQEHVLKPILMRLCARYLVRERREGRALDRVAHFHLGNGARIERLNWLGDPSPNGLKQACGLMVNYRYKLDDVDANHAAYADGKIVASNEVRRLAKA